MTSMNEISTEELPSIDLEVVRQINIPSAPNDAQFKQWVLATIAGHRPTASLAIVLMDATTIQRYNAEYRHKNKPTNVISFPTELADEIASDLIGDILLCPTVIQQEIETDSMDAEAHWAHLTVHSVLHLLGYDHESDTDAKIMEDKEIIILETLGYANPY